MATLFAFSLLSRQLMHLAAKWGQKDKRNFIHRGTGGHRWSPLQYPDNDVYIYRNGEEQYAEKLRNAQKNLLRSNEFYYTKDRQFSKQWICQLLGSVPKNIRKRRSHTDMYYLPKRIFPSKNIPEFLQFDQ